MNSTIQTLISASLDDLDAAIHELTLKRDRITNLSHLKRKQLGLESRFDVYDVVKVIGELACRIRSISLVDLYSRKRDQWLAETRFIVWSLSRKYTSLTVTRIGNLFKYDHGSICHGCSRADDLLESDPKFKRDYLVVEQEFKTQRDWKPWIDSDRPALIVSAIKSPSSIVTREIISKSVAA